MSVCVCLYMIKCFDICGMHYDMLAKQDAHSYTILFYIYLLVRSMHFVITQAHPSVPSPTSGRLAMGMAYHLIS